MISAQEFMTEIAGKIPIAKALGVDCLEFTEDRVRMSVKFEPNRNHVNSVFGGSLYAVAALASYGLFRAMTEQHGINDDFLVIQEGHITYVRPVTTDFEVVASRPADIDVPKFVESIQRFGKGRLELMSRISLNGKDCAVFKGIYVLKQPGVS